MVLVRNTLIFEWPPAALAGLELNVIFEETLRRFPAMEPAGRPSGVESAFLNQLKTLPVRLGR